MASSARAVTKLKTDWAKLASVVSKQEHTKLNKMKSFCDGNVRKMNSLPDQLPTIDWAYYKANASDPKLVDELEKSFKSIKVEYPVSPEAKLKELNEIEAAHIARGKKFIDGTKAIIVRAQEIKGKFEKMIPVKDMTQEDWALTFPAWSVHYTRPSIAPHYDRIPGISREQAMEYAKPDPLPYSTPAAHVEWEKTKQVYYK